MFPNDGKSFCQIFYIFFFMWTGQGRVKVLKTSPPKHLSCCTFCPNFFRVIDKSYSKLHWSNICETLEVGRDALSISFLAQTSNFPTASPACWTTLHLSHQSNSGSHFSFLYYYYWQIHFLAWYSDLNKCWWVWGCEKLTAVYLTNRPFEAIFRTDTTYPNVITSLSLA